MWFTNEANIDSVDIYRQTPLVYAIWNRHVLVIKELLKAGARVDLPDDIWGTPFSYAMFSGHAGISEQLLKGRDEINLTLKDSEGGELLASTVKRAMSMLLSCC